MDIGIKAMFRELWVDKFGWDKLAVYGVTEKIKLERWAEFKLWRDINIKY